MGILESLDVGKSIIRRLAEESPSLVDEATSLEALPSMMRLPERDPRREDRDFFELAFGFIPTFNIGSALGIQGIPGLVADIALDPLNFIGLPFALTKGGKAARWLRAVAKGGSAKEGVAHIAKGVDTARRLEVASLQFTKDLIAKNPAKAEQRIGSLIKNARRVELGREEAGAVRDIAKGTAAPKTVSGRVVEIAGELEEDGKKFFLKNRVLPGMRTLRQVGGALRAGGPEAATKFLDEEIARKMAMRSKLVELGTAAGKADPKEVTRVANELRKMDRSVVGKRYFAKENIRAMRLALEMEQAGQKIAPAARASSLEGKIANELVAGTEGMAQPHRALVRVRVPFTDIEHTIAVGGPVLGAAAKAVTKVGLGKYAAAPGLLAGARLANQGLDARYKVPNPDAAYGTLSQLMRATRDIVTNTPEKIKAESYFSYHDVFLKNNVAGKTLGFLTEHHINSYVQGVAETLPLYAKRMMNKSLAERVEASKNALRLLVEQPKKFMDLPDNARSLLQGALNEEAKALGMTDSHLLMADEIRTELNAMADMALQNGTIESLIGDGINTGYFPRWAQIVKGREAEYEAWFKANVKGKEQVKSFYSHAKERTLPYYEDLLKLEKAGVVKVLKDPALLMREYVEAFVRANSRAKIFKQLGEAKIPLEISTKMGGIPKAEMVPIFIKEYGDEYKHLKAAGTHEFVKDDFILDFARQFGITPHDGGVLIEKQSAAQMRHLLVKDEPGAVMRAAMRLNSIAKRSLLSLSAFHYMALTQSAAADLGWEFFRHPLQAIKSGQRSFFDATDEMLYAVQKGGLTLGPMMDAEVDVVRRGLMASEKDIPFASKAHREVAKMTGIWDRGLWDYYHNAAKLHAFQQIHSNAIVNFGDKIKDPEQIAKGVAEHVNRAFGGLQWERMMVSAPMQRWMRILMLAPDWTVSNIQIATDVFANKFKKFDWYQRTGKWWGFPVGPNDVLQADVRAFYARRTAFHTAAMYFPFMSMINHAFTGHHIWDNAEGRRTMIELPWKDSDGRKLYSDVGKQFREPMEFFEDLTKFPELKTIRRKHSQILGKGIAAVTGRDLFTGVPIVAESKGMMYDSARRLWYMIGGALPIPIQEALAPVTKEMGVGPGRAEKSALSIMLGMAGLPIRTEFKRPAPKEIPEAFDDVVKTDTYKRQIEKLAREAATGQPFMLPVSR